MSYQGAHGFQPKQNKFKPFENKWSRFSSVTSGGSPHQQQQQHHDKQIQSNHKCTNPDSCRSQIIEDLEHERPLWKLTCYGHCKSAPCDIVGDVSYEELRAAAYTDLKAGSNLISVVERETSMVNLKLAEFKNIINKYPPASPNLPLISTTNDPPTVSSFSQLGSTMNIPSSVKPSNTNPFGSFSHQNTGSSGQFGAQFSVQKHASLPSESFNFFNSEYKSASSPNFFTENQVSAINKSSMLLAPPGISSLNNMNEETSGDPSIWTKEEWKIGEIPEEEPPQDFISTPVM